MKQRYKDMIAGLILALGVTLVAGQAKADVWIDNQMEMKQLTHEVKQANQDVEAFTISVNTQDKKDKDIIRIGECYGYTSIIMENKASGMWESRHIIEEVKASAYLDDENTAWLLYIGSGYAAGVVDTSYASMRARGMGGDHSAKAIKVRLAEMAYEKRCITSL